MQAPFFIVGNDRSGTTMLRLVLDRGPSVAIPPESMFLADFAPVRRAGGLGDPERARRLLERVWRHPKVRLWGLPGGPPPVPTGLSHAEAYRYVVEAPFRAYALAHGKPRFADKTPPYLHMVDELLEVWPEARVVVLVRDGRDVALSIRRLPFGPNNVWAAAHWWARGIRVGLRAQEAHPGQVLTIRYEDVAADPQASVARICEFVGMAFDPDMLAIERADRSKIVADQAGWFPGLWRQIDAAGVGRWRTAMSPHDQRLFATIAGPELAAFGYSGGEANGARPTPARRRLYELHNEALRNVNFVRLRIVHERGRELRYALGRKVARTRGRGYL